MPSTTDYAAFLAAKIARVHPAGRDIATSDVHPRLHQWQAEVVQWAARVGRAAMWEDTGLGKQQPVSEPVLTPSGWRPIGDLAVGDEVIGSDGRPTKVTGVYPQGVKPVYRMWLSDGTSVRCGGEHLWSVRTKVQKYRGQPFSVMTTQQIADSVHRDWQLPVVAPVQHDAADLPVDPYALGVLLGDGSLSSHQVQVCTDDEIGSSLGWRKQRDHDSAGIGYWIPDPKTMDGITALGLRGKRSWEKHVPTVYMHAPEGDRRALLAGLLDTDGYAMPEGGAEFSSTSRALVDAVCELVRSLGGVSRGLRRAHAQYTHNGEQRTGREAWRVNVRVPAPHIPFRLTRKAVQYSMPTKYAPARIVRRVVDEGVDEPQVCIRVAAADSLYVTRDHIVTHNTIQQIEWARVMCEPTDGIALIVAPLAVCAQTVREAAKVQVEARYVRHQDEIAEPGIYVTNYEMVTRFDPTTLTAVVLDEASVLKQSDGKTRTTLIDHFRGVPYRLACTATPAPNDPEELTNQAEFLGHMTRVNMLAAYFVHDADGWRMKGHARAPMMRWMATWALALRRPSDLGYPDDGYVLPGLDVIPHLLPVNSAPDDQLFATDLGGVSGRAKVRRDTLAARCEQTAALVAAEAGEPWLLWAGLNDEADMLADLIPGAVNVHGSLSPEEKAAHLLAFADGQIRYLITKPSIASFGMNFQHCARTAFVGLSDSFETYYQAIRRCYRYGQTRVVHAHVVLSELEAEIAANIARKERAAAAVTGALVEEMRRARNLQEIPA